MSVKSFLSERSFSGMLVLETAADFVILHSSVPHSKSYSPPLPEDKLLSCFNGSTPTAIEKKTGFQDCRFSGFGGWSLRNFSNVS